MEQNLDGHNGSECHRNRTNPVCLGDVTDWPLSVCSVLYSQASAGVDRQHRPDSLREQERAGVLPSTDPRASSGGLVRGGSDDTRSKEEFRRIFSDVRRIMQLPRGRAQRACALGK